MATLHDKIEESKQANKDLLDNQVKKREQRALLYKNVFETDDGKKVLDELTAAYVDPIVSGKTEFGEVMYIEGQASVIKAIKIIINGVKNEKN